MKKHIIGILAACHLIMLSPAHAQDATSARLNFSQALEKAFAYDQDLQAAEFQYMSTLESRGLSKAALLPQINFSLSTNRTENSTKNSSQPGFIPNRNITINTDGFDLSLSQTIYNHSLYKKLQQTDMDIAAATANVEAARQNLIVRLATAYFNVLGAQDALRFATAEKKAIGKQLEQSKKRFEVGLIAITDVKESQASYDTSVAAEIDAQNTLAAQFEALAVILGEYTTNITPLAEEFTLSLPEPANIQDWTDSALENNLALRAAQFTYQASQKQVDADQSKHYPTLDLVASHRFSSPDNSTFVAFDTTSTSVTVQLNVPIYSGGFTSAKKRQSIALKDRARALKEKAHRQTLQQTRDAYLNVTSTIAQVHALKQALISSQAAQEATQAGFEVGTRTAIDVLTTLRDVFRAERDYARARYNYVINTLRLKQAAGTLTVRDGIAINNFLQ
ncbi:MAG TPA: type I secretion protein TolC [Gammaproteobacteria bacterium]|nr:type I secretion protein TolC [Gammaproteobacteria bacterium]